MNKSFRRIDGNEQNKKIYMNTKKKKVKKKKIKSLWLWTHKERKRKLDIKCDFMKVQQTKLACSWALYSSSFLSLFFYSHAHTNHTLHDIKREFNIQDKGIDIYVLSSYMRSHYHFYTRGHGHHEPSWFSSKLYNDTAWRR